MDEGEMHQGRTLIYDYLFLISRKLGKWEKTCENDIQVIQFNLDKWVEGKGL